MKNINYIGKQFVWNNTTYTVKKMMGDSNQAYVCKPVKGSSDKRERWFMIDELNDLIK